MMTNKKIQSIGLFCGSRKGNSPAYEQDAIELGKLMAEKNIQLVYGGGGIGLMQSAADAVLQHGGMVIGVLPRFFDEHEVGHEHISEMIMVDSMSERKVKMAELSGAFIALPGGYGTMDELFEMLVNSQLSLHDKPVGVLNTNHFFDATLQQLEHMKNEGFLNDFHQQMLIVDESPSVLLQKLFDFSNPQDKHWIDKVRK